MSDRRLTQQQQQQKHRNLDLKLREVCALVMGIIKEIQNPTIILHCLLFFFCLPLTNLFTSSFVKHVHYAAAASFCHISAHHDHIYVQTYRSEIATLAGFMFPLKFTHRFVVRRPSSSPLLLVPPQYKRYVVFEYADGYIVSVCLLVVSLLSILRWPKLCANCCQTYSHVYSNTFSLS